MARGIGNPRRWQVAAAAAQLGLVAGCAGIGWQLAHPAPTAGAISIRHAMGTPRAEATPLVAPAVLSRPQSTPRRPGLEALVNRVNRDDGRLYRAQWSALEVITAGTRTYLLKHVLPLLQAAAGGDNR